MIDRRSFVVAVAGTAVMASLPARAQQSGKVWRLAYLSYGATPVPGISNVEDGFWQRLRELGYVEGANLIVWKRYDEGKPERLPDLAAELVRLNPDIIVSRAVPANIAAKNATATIPIVMATGLDPVREGIVASLARPGGNVTGMSFASDTNIVAKRVQLLKELMPKLSRLAAVVDIPPKRNPATEHWFRDAEEAARALGVKLQPMWVEDPSAWSDAFASMVESRAEAVYLVESPVFIAHARRIAELAQKHRIPSMFGAREHVVGGGLMSYGLNIPAVFRRAAELADKVLKGAKPAEMPIEQPTKYELVINLTTAKALGIAVPAALLARAEEVVG